MEQSLKRARNERANSVWETGQFAIAANIAGAAGIPPAASSTTGIIPKDYGMNGKHKVGAAMRHFAIQGTFSGAVPYGTGHINDTYRVVFADAGKLEPFLVQRINHNIFKNPPALMDNIRAGNLAFRRGILHGAGRSAPLPHPDTVARSTRVAPGRGWQL